MKLTYKGIEINYDISGKGKPLVFLHGFLENNKMWEDVCPYFEENHTCITIDLLGHGKTGCLGYIHSMEDMAKAVQAVLDFVNAKNCTVIGHSMGGYVMMALIDLFPDLVDHLVLLNSTSIEDSKEKKSNRDRAISIVKKNPNAYTSMAIANLFAENNRTRFVKDIEKIRKQASLTPLQGIISALEGMKIRKDRSNLLHDFNGRKIIFAGKEDPVLPFDHSHQESKKYNSGLVAFDGGHMTYIETKKKFITSLLDFTSKN